jgi:hypothetical protein
MQPPLRRNVRSRLWPTRRWYDIRQDEVEERIASLQGAVAALAAGQQQLLDGQAELRTRLRRAQALTARVYEGLHDWPGLLQAARGHPNYELAYSDPDPLISIAISTYHSPDTLCDRALASVLAQTHSNWEAIVVGDHCTDDTEARVQAIGDPRIRFHNLAVREVDPEDPWERWAVKGSIPRATGIAMASGRWIAPLSHDDRWDPDHLEILLQAARDRRAEYVYSQMRIFGVDAPAAALPASIGAWPPRLGQFACQSSLFHGLLKFLRYDRACALASEPNDWNLGRRAWEAGVRFEFVSRDTSTLYVYDRHTPIAAEYAERGLPPSAQAFP